MIVTAVVPIRSFDGMSRLSRSLTATDRHILGRDVATRVVRACRNAGLAVGVVSGSDEVRSWALESGAGIVDEPPSPGLDGAASAGISSLAATPWLVVHGDLPAITPEDLRAAVERLQCGIVLAPSHDGGTPLIGGTGTSFPFRYGPASFRRHLSAVGGRASVLVRPGLALDLDRPWDLQALRRLGYLGAGIIRDPTTPAR